MDINENTNRRKVKWTNEGEFELTQGKASANIIVRMFMFLPIALVVSVLIVIITIAGMPLLFDGMDSVSGMFHGNSEIMRNAPLEQVFDDVAPDHPQYMVLQSLKNKGIISGYEDNTFRPDAELRRAELVKTIVNAKKVFPLALNHNSCFKDVTNEWYAPAVCFAKNKQWINGYDNNTFEPMENVSRAESLKIVMEAFNLAADSSDDDVPMYKDVEVEDWFYPYVKGALKDGLLTDNTNLELFYPERILKRGEMADLIFRANEL